MYYAMRRRVQYAISNTIGHAFDPGPSSGCDVWRVASAILLCISLEKNAF